jgi:hypothetical protein
MPKPYVFGTNRARRRRRSTDSFRRPPDELPGAIDVPEVPTHGYPRDAFLKNAHLIERRFDDESTRDVDEALLLADADGRKAVRDPLVAFERVLVRFPR